MSEDIDLFKDDRARRAVQQEAYRASSLFSRADEPFRHDRSKPLSYCEVDTAFICDHKSDSHFDLFGNPITRDEMSRRRDLEASRVAKIKADKEAKEARLRTEETARYNARRERSAANTTEK